MYSVIEYLPGERRSSRNVVARIIRQDTEAIVVRTRDGFTYPIDLDAVVTVDGKPLD